MQVEQSFLQVLEPICGSSHHRLKEYQAEMSGYLK
jgi:hypothetical protein